MAPESHASTSALLGEGRNRPIVVYDLREIRVGDETLGRVDVVRVGAEE